MKIHSTLIYTTLTCIIMMGLSINAAAQYDVYNPVPGHEFSIGVKAGLSDMWGDIGTKGTLDHYANGKYFQNTHYMGGVLLRYSLTSWLAARLEVGAGTIYATDAWNIKEANKGGPNSPAYNIYVRNQDMKSTLLEGLLNIELSPLRLLDANHSGKWRIQPVAVAGVGVFHFNPKTTYINPNGSVSWVETHPLHLEGEGLDYIDAPKGYKLTQVCVPIGAGLRYELNSRVSMGFEYLLRLTFTDYLDGVSNKYVDPTIFSKYLGEGDAAIALQVYNKTGQIDPAISHPAGDIRGNPKSRDAYSTIGFHLSVRLPSKADRY